MTERTPRLPEGSAGPSPALEPMDAAALAAWHAGGAPELLAEPLPPSATAWLLHVLVARPPETLVCVADGPKTLDVLAQDVAALRSLAGVVAETAVFPAWESLPGHGPPPPPELTGDRLEALRRLAGPAPRVVLTCVQALMQRTVPPDFLAGRALRLAPGAHLERHDLTAFLEQAGYDFHVEVQSPGQAAVRGGIVDAWPPADPLPVRIELCGPEVESLRRFDPADQRSRGEIPSVELGPAGEPEEASASSFAEHVPPGAWWVWCDMRAIARHAEILDGAAREAGAEAAIVPAAQALAARPGDRHLRLGWPEEGGPAALAFGLRPVEGVPTLPGSAYRPDLVDEARARFVDLLAGRARDGWRIALFFASEGARDRFREVHGPKLAPFAGVSVHLGGLSEGFEVPAARLMVVSEADFLARRKEVRGRYELGGAGAGARRPARVPEAERIADWSGVEPGDLVVHVDHGVGKYQGLSELVLQGGRQEVMTIEYAEGGRLYVPVSQSHLLSRYVGVGGRRPDLHALGGKRWAREKSAAQRGVQDLAAALLETQAARDALPGHAFAPDLPWQHEFESAFPYAETPDQQQAIVDVKRDMEQTRPMDRLVCGDVGYGKTEVAMRAAFKAVMDGRQVALLVPTTVLAQQHFETFAARLAAFPVRLEMLSRFQTAAEQTDILARLAAGQVDIVIGTHRLVQSDVRFRNLGLVIIDEEQRFGVRHKELLKQQQRMVDVLTLTATPIPRTLYMSLTGARDLSTIQTPPVERMPIETLVSAYDEKVIREAILRELNREGQVYFLHNRVQTIERERERLQTLVPEARIRVAHGQMPERALADIMHAFVRGDFDVLLCTTIIESGLDIPNVNTILIDRADRFGMAELYQLRGRVGRYKRKAFAYLLLPRHGRLFDTARRRIVAIRRHTHLGAGFKLALRDLELRGAGNLLGPQQSGHIAAVGFDLYCQYLRRTVAGLKGEAVPVLIDVQVRLDFLRLAPAGADEDGAAVLPPAFVEDEGQRIAIYRRLAACAADADVKALRAELRDRYGRLPPAAERLLDLAQLRIAAAAVEIRRIEVEGDKVLLTRGGDLVTLGNRLPRLTRRGAAARMAELIRLVRGLRPPRPDGT